MFSFGRSLLSKIPVVGRLFRSPAPKVAPDPVGPTPSTPAAAGIDWGKVGSSVLSTVGQSVAAPLAGKLGQSATDKIFGVPTPVTGKQAGEFDLARMDAAYPGTTAWERLGQHSAAASMLSQDASNKSAERIAKQEISSRLALTNLGGRYQLAAATAHLGPEAMRSAQDVVEGRPGKSYDTPTAVSRDDLSRKLRETLAMIPNINEDTRNKIAQRLLLSAQRQLAMNDAGIARERLLLERDLRQSEIDRNKSIALMQHVLSFVAGTRGLVGFGGGVRTAKYGMERVWTTPGKYFKLKSPVKTKTTNLKIGR